ncbi:alkaline phosphatase family protein [Actinosynnema pretiosum subsp. pretiosum]|uniref:Alkaline phosphatase family protein n=1 Tax=Actinosynnema pretiosum subsp. pretiosum TaxID=103721 RepID=A0AA45L9X1_9PSEU|nr:Alkaline phosphodiesterase I [Actinosynnema pretiosum subsp. pretiosum]QUF05455.1 alkaline phosphatase family protein [Actinosynnema pretiosum subsp. pretiosum]
MEPLLPRYRAGALSDVVPSLLAGMGVPGAVDVLGISGAARVCVLLVDGLGWELLREHADAAPFLSSLAQGREAITAGFPSSTATSVAALGTGLPTGEHGIVGYTFAAVGADGEELVNALSWQRHTGQGDLRSVLVPEEVQPTPTAFERAAEAGVLVKVLASWAFQGSGLTRAVLRGGEFVGAHALGDLVSGVASALRERDRVLCYAYHADLDALGHGHGPGSESWVAQLSVVDRLAELISERLPEGGALVVTADHGMVRVTDRVDFDQEPGLREGVRLLGGEPRVRHVHVEPGAEDAVRARWTAVLGERAWVVSRAEAIEAGWFGPRVADHVRPRVGDLVVAARGGAVVIRSAAEPLLSVFPGHHGSLTAAEQLVPLLVSTR